MFNFTKGMEDLINMWLPANCMTMLNMIGNHMKAQNKFMGNFLEPLMKNATTFMQDQTVPTPDHAILMLNQLTSCMKGSIGALESIRVYQQKLMKDFKTASKYGKMNEWLEKQAQIANFVANDFPAAVEAIEPRVGFHFDDGGYELMHETPTERLWLIKSDKMRPDGKPIIVVGPYVLGLKVLNLLPDSGFSFVGAFADRGVPSAVVELKDIQTTEAVQLMTPEDLTENRRIFAKVMAKRFRQKAAYVTYCQGGPLTMYAMATGNVTDADAFMSVVSPLDGSLSPGLKTYLNELPEQFRQVKYAGKRLPSGNIVVDGPSMSNVYKQISIQDENPVSDFIKALNDAERGGCRVSDFAAAIACWLADKVDLSVHIIEKMSFPGYDQAIGENGELPVTIAGQKLSLQMFNELGIKVLAVGASDDNLVSPASARAICDYVDKAKEMMFETGHIGIGTSHSNEAKCQKTGKKYIGDDDSLVGWVLALDKNYRG